MWESGERYICTKENPWTKEISDTAIHPDAVSGEDRDFGGGEYCASYKCPNCGLHFYVELAQ